MAVPTLISNLTTINSCDDSVGLAGDTFVAEPDDKKQGTNSQTWAATNNGRNTIDISVASVALGTEHIRLWFKSVITGFYVPTTGLQLEAVHGGGTAIWNIDPNNEYKGGWLNIVIYGGSTPDSGVAIGGNLVTSLTVVQNTSSKPRNTINSWIDYVRYGDGFIATGGTSGDEITLSGIATQDALNGYGIVENINSVKFIYGSVQIGNGATTTWFNDSGDIAVYADANVSTSLYKFLYSGTGCTVNIAGGVYSAAGTQNFNMDATGTGILSFNMSGKQLVRANNSTFLSGQDISNNVFDKCGQIVPSASIFTKNTISNSVHPTGALLFPDAGNTTDCTFINNDNAIEVPQSTDQTFNALIFDDVAGKYDVYVSGGSAINIAKVGGSNPNSYNPLGSVPTFTASFVLTLTNIPTGINVTLVNSSTRVELQHTVTSGANVTFSHSGGETIDILLMGEGIDPNLSDIYDLTLDNASQSIKFQTLTDINYIA